MSRELQSSYGRILYRKRERVAIGSGEDESLVVVDSLCSCSLAVLEHLEARNHHARCYRLQKDVQC